MKQKLIKFFDHTKIAMLLFLITLCSYLLFYTGEQKHLNYFVPLADAFLQGRLHLEENPPWLNELINVNGKYYVVYPPMPTILLLPIVALAGPNFSQPIFSIIIAAINVALCFLVVTRIFKLQKVGILAAILYGFGTMLWYHAVIGSAWYIAHIISNFFIWFALMELFGKKRYLLVGLLIGAAYWSRLPAILALTFPILFYWQEFISLKPKLKIKGRNIVLLGAGVGIFIVLNAIYNYLRFGVIYDISYQLLPVFEEPWYQNGLFSIVNIPTHIAEILFALPKFSPNFPYLIPSLHVVALWFVTPALFLLLQIPIKQKLTWSLLITIVIMLLPGLMHGSNGFTQWGFRFAIDLLPFVILLITTVLAKKISYVAVSLIVISVLINLWTMIVITQLKIWTM